MIQIQLPAELETFVGRLIDAGQYATPAEAVLDGLRLLKEQTDLHAVRLEELRQQIAVGMEQAERGESAPLDMKAIQDEAARLVRQEKGQEADACPR